VACPCVRPPDKKDTGPDHIFLINTTSYIPFSDTFVVFHESKKRAKKESEMQTREVFFAISRKTG
jgi:hypothetical protein